MIRSMEFAFTIDWKSVRYPTLVGQMPTEFEFKLSYSQSLYTCLHVQRGNIQWYVQEWWFGGVCNHPHSLTQCCQQEMPSLQSNIPLL